VQPSGIRAKARWKALGGFNRQSSMSIASVFWR